MGCWGMGVTQSDEFCEFYDRFMELYDVGKDIAEIPRELLAEYEREFEPDDGVFHDVYFAIAKAQWMCGGVQPGIMQKVEEIISGGANIEFMRELEASEADLKQRQRNLSKFLMQLQTPRPTVRKRRPPAKPRELPQMEPGDVFSYKMDKGVRVFIILGEQNLPIEWDSLPVCILRSNFSKTPDLSAVLHEPVGIVCCIDTKAYPAKSKLKHLGRIALPEGLFIQWNKVPHPPLTAALDYCDYYHVNPQNTLPEDYPLPISSIVFLQSDCRKLFTRDFSDVTGDYLLRDLLYPKENPK